jgi:hypothetical protein
MRKGHGVGWRQPGWRLNFFLLAAVSTQDSPGDHNQKGTADDA